MEKYTTIDEYISSFPLETQKILQQLRKDLQQMVPNAKEKISYGIPTFTLNGNLIHFAGYKNHIGLYPGSKAIEIFAEDLKNYPTSTGTVQFPIDKPLPMVLIKKIHFCLFVQQNNTTIPIILTNENGEIFKHSNIDESISNDSIKLKKYAIVNHYIQFIRNKISFSYVNYA